MVILPPDITTTLTMFGSSDAISVPSRTDEVLLFFVHSDVLLVQITYILYQGIIKYQETKARP